MDHASRVGVLDKTQRILDALELGPHDLSDLTHETGLTRPTAHRLAVALESHGMAGRDSDGRFILGARISQLAASAVADRLVAVARPVLEGLRDTTGESAQLYRRRAGRRLCVAVADLPSGLRDTVPLGASMTLLAGSAAQVLLAWESASVQERFLADAAFNFDALAQVRERGWAQSVAEREQGVASVSAPVFGPAGRVLAAISVSGPIERIGRSPGKRWGPATVAAAKQLSARLEE
ncbi:MAG: IclR family transcriptional regulator [Candidatus Nanopelagicales bacterium]|nr:IclR family transcriptional regulator [Candidatus Nanopelagicales bacterium]MDZ4250872.1 IclR family transcriptional regulator [Candidatus Nanopelagicales bacterium]MDZ7576976.1 IclR family transcriptional regulator [Candidatus Nanopelagicales bacterium]